MHVRVYEMGSTRWGGAKYKNRIIILSWSNADMLGLGVAGIGDGAWCRSTSWVR